MLDLFVMHVVRHGLGAACVGTVIALLLSRSGNNDSGVVTSPDLTVLHRAPRVWTIRNFVSPSEVDALVALVDAAERARDPRCWERVSSHQSTAMIERCPQLAEAPLMRVIDARVAAALNTTLRRIEHGYYQVYRGGYSPHNVHLDQGFEMVPARIASAIIYLDSQPRGACSGSTLFPFLERAGSSEKAAAYISMQLQAWDRKLKKGLITSRFFTADGIGAELFARFKRLCAAGRVAAVRVCPVRGTALFFEGRVRSTSSDDSAKPADMLVETIQAAHGSCGLLDDAPTKRVLVKLACDGDVR